MRSRIGAQGRARLALVLLAVEMAGGCVDKAPPPMWPAPPPPRVATPLRADETVQVPDNVATPAGPLDDVPVETSILDPEGPAAAAVPKGSPSPRRVPEHR